MISGRDSAALVVRARQCHMKYIYQGHIEKTPIYERILAEARAAAAALLRDAQRLAAAEGKQLEAQLRAEAARKAVALATDKIRQQWGSDDQQRMVAEFIRHVQS